MTELTRARIEAIKNGAPRIDESEIVALCDLATKALDQANALPPDLAAIAARNAATGALVTPEQLRYLRAATEYVKSCQTEMDHGGYYSFNHIPTIEKLPDEVDRLNAEVARLTAVIEHDRSKVVDVLAEANAVLKNYGWLAEGRGSYTFDDDRWKDEFKACMDSLAKVLDPMRGIASDLSDSPIKWADIVAARSMTDALAEAEKLFMRIEGEAKAGRAYAMDGHQTDLPPATAIKFSSIISIAGERKGASAMVRP